MPLVPRVASFWKTLFRRPRLDAELDVEVREYQRQLVERKVREGMDPEAARREAAIEMGGVEQVKEHVGDARIGVGIETTLRDAVYAWRGLCRHPGFALSAVLTLGMGIGASVAIFSVISAMLLEPLPYRDSSRLVFVWSDMSEAGYPRAPLSGPELADLRERAKSFSGFAGIWANSLTLSGKGSGSGDGDPERIRVGLVTPDFFSVLGADAALGRTILPSEDVGEPGIVLAAGLWQRRFGGDRGIVGRRILVNGQPTTVVGVMPPDFRLMLPPDSAVPDDLEAWVPFWPKMMEGPRGQQFLRVVGRLRPGATLEQGRREIEAVAAQVSREFPEYGAAGRRYDTVGLHADGVREVRPILLTLFGGVGILCLITCANVAGLLAAKAASRRKEIALRVALGAGPGRLFRQCLVEGLLLSALGAAAGIGFARGILAVLGAVRPESLSRIAMASIDLRVLAFTGGTTLLWSLLLSLTPLGEVVGTSPFAAMKREGGGTRSRTRAVLVAVQVALGVVLIVGAGLIARTFVRLNEVDLGFRKEYVLSFRLGLPEARYENREAFNAFGRRFEEELSTLPGVLGVASVSHLPFDHIPNWGGAYVAAAGEDATTAPMADYRAVTPGFFETMGASLVAGRGFEEADDTDAIVVMVDERLAQRTWPGQSAIGKKLAVDPRSTGEPKTPATVVGVVRHVRDRSLREDVREQVYFAQRQINRNPAAYLVRASGNPATLAGSVREVLGRLDPALPLSEVRPLADYVVEAGGAQRFTMLLAAAFAAMSVLLACIGLYGVVAYSVAQRGKEFGIRLALGALPRQVRMLVVREGVAVAAAGLAIGLPAAILAARLIRSQLYGVTPFDAASYAIAIATLGVAAVAASWFAARKATSASPLSVLRAE